MNIVYFSPKDEFLEEYEDPRNCYLSFSPNSRNFEANYEAMLPMAEVFVNSEWLKISCWA